MDIYYLNVVAYAIWTCRLPVFFLNLKDTLSSTRCSISLEWPRILKQAAKNGGRVGYLPLESNISTWSKVPYLKTKVDMLFVTIKHCQNFTLAKGHCAGVTVEKCMRMELFVFVFLFLFCVLIPHFFLLPLSLSSLLFCLFLRISSAGSFEPRMISFSVFRFLTLPGNWVT